MSLRSVPVVGGKYALISKLGQGAMADVYLGLSEGVQGFAKLAVVKLLRSHLVEDADFVARFLEEGRLSMRLAHPNIVQTYEVGGEGKSYYLSMEFLQGQTLASILNRCGLEHDKFDFACTAYVLAEVLAAMEYAHELADYDGTPLRVVHRDLSPPNIFVTYDGQVKVLDFGIAKALDSAIETKTGIILGKTRYMSPEQALGEQLDCRTDLYAIGVMLWEAAAGRRRWSGLSDPEIVRELVTSEFVDLPGAAERGLPDRVDEIVARALAPDRDDRYHSAGDFRRDLEDVLHEMQRDLSGRALGRIVAEVFQAERARLEREVQLKVGKLENRGIQSVPAASLEASESRPPTIPRTDNGTSIAPISTGAQRFGTSVSEGFPFRRNAWPIAATVSLVLLGLLIGWNELSSRNHEPAGSASPAPSARVTIRLSAIPEQANIYLDGARLAGNPAVLERAPDDQNHELRAEAPGHRTEVRSIQLGRDLEVQLQLRPDPPAAVAEVAPARSETTRKETDLERSASRTSASKLERKEQPARSASESPAPVGRAAFPPNGAPVPARSATESKDGKDPPKVKIDMGNPWQ